MKITLGTHIVVEQVGQQMFLLDSQNKQVYSLPAEGVVEYSPDTKTVSLAPSLVSEAQKLVDAGVATLPGMVSRRAVVGSTGALVAGGLVAMSMPSAAMAASPVPNGLGGGGEPEGIPAGFWTPFGGDLESRFEIGFYVEESDDLSNALGEIDETEWTLTVFGQTSEFEDDDDDPNFEFQFGLCQEVEFGPWVPCPDEEDRAAYEFFVSIFQACPPGSRGDHPVQGVMSNGQDGGDEKSVLVVFRWDGDNSNVLWDC